MKRKKIWGIYTWIFAQKKDLKKTKQNMFYLCCRLVDEDVILPSFFAQYGYKNKLCATDVVHVTAAVLETSVSWVY